MTQLNPVIAEVTARIEARSAEARLDYEARMAAARHDGPARMRLSCSNLAHAFAAAGDDKPALKFGAWPNLGIVTAYNDMLSAHQPYEDYPERIRGFARAAGATAQVAGGVPAMCDGVTQGAAGMELSLFSRDVIALATGVALTHNAFDGALLLGICDKIVPGLFIGAAPFGHLPILFVPGGPMPSGLPNPAKAKVRQRYAAGEATRAELLEAEADSYHSPGTCTFYGTANSNQMLMEIMGLHVPGAAFVPPGTALRDALTQEAVRLAAVTTALKGEAYRPFTQVITAKALVNGIVGLMATGGSTNHTIHLIAMARAVGLTITWEDMADISHVTPLLARVYPNGVADVNHFHAAGGMGFVIRELMASGGVHTDVATVAGLGLAAYAREPSLADGVLVWRDAPTVSGDMTLLRPARDPFMPEGGLRLLTGNLGRSVIKISAVAPEYRKITAPARVFASQEAMLDAYKAGELERDVIVVVRFQGPRANGMPELHKLTPSLTNLQDKGYKVALVTDGRMSGASGKVAAAIHLSPAADSEGPIARIQDGDVITLDAMAGTLDVHVEAEVFARRAPVRHSNNESRFGVGRELFETFRMTASPADQGGSVLFNR